MPNDTKKPLTLNSDIPSEEWLAGKIRQSVSRGANQWGVPTMTAITGHYSRPAMVPLAILRHIPGQRAEQSNVRTKDLDRLLSDLAFVTPGDMEDTSEDTPGWQAPPYIEVDRHGQAWLSEGNHRVMAADLLQWPCLPVDIRYFDGGERAPYGTLAPEKVLAWDAHERMALAENAADGQDEEEKDRPRAG